MLQLVYGTSVILLRKDHPACLSTCGGHTINKRQHVVETL